MKYLLLTIGMVCGFASQSFAFLPTSPAPSILKLGHFQSRAIWTPQQSPKNEKLPAIILLPGSGPHGPRELIPGYLTVSGKDEPLFDQVAKALNLGGIQTLQLGKPGIEDRTDFDISKIFYDKNLHVNLHWKDLLSNMEEALEFARTQPTVDPRRIYLLGHSEGTPLAIDFTKAHPEVAGVILLGYFGDSMASIVDWQFYRREIEYFIAVDVDTDHDGFVSRAEAARWPKFSFGLAPDQEKISLTEIEALFRKSPDNQKAVQKLSTFPLYADGIWDRPAMYALAASLPQVLYVFNGALDLQTPAQQALNLKQACLKAGKTNCHITIVPGLGHGFSPPKPPRSHPFLDLSVGPIDPSFLETLTELGRHLSRPETPE